MGKTKDFSLGLIVGALAGSVVTLLYTPEKGRTVRDRLSFKLSSYADELSGSIERLRKERDQMVSEAKKRGNDVITDAQSRARNLMNEADSLLQSAGQDGKAPRNEPTDGTQNAEGESKGD